MPNGREYAVRAALRRAAGDLQGRHAAASTCYQRAKRKTACALPKLPTPGADKGLDQRQASQS